MRRLALTLLSLLFVACSDEPTAPTATRLSAPSIVSASASSAAQIFQSTYEVPADLVFSPADFPCLTEPVHVAGAFLEHDVLIVGSTELQLTQHQSNGTVTATGVNSGDTYAFSGPFTFTGTVPRDADAVRELTVRNINHIVGPGGDSDLFLQLLYHVTINPVTGEIRTEIFRGEVRCN